MKLPVPDTLLCKLQVAAVRYVRYVMGVNAVKQLPVFPLRICVIICSSKVRFRKVVLVI